MAIDVVAHLVVDDTLEPSTLGGLPHELWHVPGIAGVLLVLLGLIAIYLRQADRIGKVGLTGFVLLVVGITLGAVYSTTFHGLFLPAIEELPIAEMWVGFRPTSRDDAPILGPGPVEGLYLATGHHRNGILLAPATADYVSRAILEGGVPDAIRGFTLGRFQRPAAPAAMSAGGRA